ncbi:hypothetical protein B0I35DRAFT_82627 [Stachybotrys elegans]|uniref:Uncharacterized protein n=1 Tax=Stachybotrys elegans TaxID=80388 RepID=A0A8K0WNI3_9HYPO|nr:hypothetical protein B0I35DRAFT_82627 [Stachybotrys elegans]
MQKCDSVTLVHADGGCQGSIGHFLYPAFSNGRMAPAFYYSPISHSLTRLPAASYSPSSPGVGRRPPNTYIPPPQRISGAYSTGSGEITIVNAKEKYGESIHGHVSPVLGQVCRTTKVYNKKCKKADPGGIVTIQAQYTIVPMCFRHETTPIRPSIRPIIRFAARNVGVCMRPSDATSLPRNPHPLLTPLSSPPLPSLSPPPCRLT